MSELKQHKIFMSDLNGGVDLLYQFSREEIHGLLGANVVGKLYTGSMKQLQSGLVLMETHLGWTIMGKMNLKKSSDMTKNIMSLHVNEAKNSDLRRLDTLGIFDPGEKGNQQKMEMAAEEHFNRSVKIDDEGRYIVSLP